MRARRPLPSIIWFTTAFAAACGCDPTISSITPNPAEPGEAVVLRGANLGATPGSLAYDDVPLAPASWSDGEIRFTTPPTATIGPHDVAVTVAGKATPPFRHAVVGPTDALATKAILSIASDRLPVFRQSCGRLGETDAQGRACALFDLDTATFPEDAAVDPTALRVFHYERWAELYAEPDGISHEIQFTERVPPGTPEAVWSDPGLFQEYEAQGDAAFMTGHVLQAAAFRYATTGTPADHARVEHYVRSALQLFEVTGIDGYLARSYFMDIDDATPVNDRRFSMARVDPSDYYRKRPIAPSAAGWIAPEYLGGYTHDGQPVAYTGRWWGTPSIDQYSSILVGFALAYDLLTDESLRAEIRHQVTCYLKRLEPIRIRNLQKALPFILDLIQLLLAGPSSSVDPTDFDLGTLDTIEGFVLSDPTSFNEGSFPTECPAAMTTTYAVDLDASAGLGFLIDLINFALTLNTGDGEVENARSIFMAPTVRGGDTYQLFLIGTLAYRMTGDPAYRDFVMRRMVRDFRALEIGRLANNLRLPKWCQPWFGYTITYPVGWAAIGLTDVAWLRREFEEAFKEEWRERPYGDDENAVFNLMYAQAVSDAVDPPEAKQPFVELAVDQIRRLGGTGGAGLLDPRRNYAVDATDPPPPGVELELPTAEDIETCRVLDGEDINPAEYRTVRPLPVELRIPHEYIWQRDPYEPKRTFGADEGREQYQGYDLILPYWLAAYTGDLPEGRRYALAWKPAP
ncbi:MAG: IPT/TIG domain-containing protein [Myxococcales bacterium]|nr:IPT/TIG domain-containing protein [Myxococcales bacterium]